MKKIKTVVVDDSALIRSLLSRIINAQNDMEVVGVAPDPLIARDIIRQTNPDVITLDIEMPRMDGLEFLEKIMRLRPMPVVMISTLTERGSEITMRALELGAVDFVSKPKVDIQNGINAFADDIVHKIRAAAHAKVKAILPGLPIAQKSRPIAAVGNTRLSSEKLIIIGASTGGTEAIKDVLCQLPPDSPAVLITQHMPAGFTASFAKRLDGLCKITVKEAVHGERVLPGHAYIAPGSQHLLLAKSGANYITQLSDEPPVNRHKPSVEVLFDSVAKSAGKNALGVMLTGMGKDGALAMLHMRQAGSFNLAQDEESCVVFGMPKEAIAVGAVDEVLPLDKIADRLLEKVMQSGDRAIRV